MKDASGLPESVIKNFNVSMLYDFMRNMPTLGIFDAVHDMIIGYINELVLNPAAAEVEAKLLVTKVQDTPVYKDAKTQADATVAKNGKNFSPMQEMAAEMTGVKPDANKNLQDARVKQGAINNTPLNVKAGASHTQLAKDHTNSIFFGLAFKLAVEADKLIRDKMLDVWGNASKVKDPDLEEAKDYRAKEAAKKKPEGIIDTVISGTKDYFDSGPSDTVKMAEARDKADKDSLSFGKSVYANGKKSGQEYDLAEMRNDSADRILAIASTIKTMANTPANAQKSLEHLKKEMGNHKIDSKAADGALNASIGIAAKADDALSESAITGLLLKDAVLFEKASFKVRNSKTLAEREAAYRELEKCKVELVRDINIILKSNVGRKLYGTAAFGTLLVMIDRELAAVAPAYTSQQVLDINGGKSTNAITPTSVNLPSLSSVDGLAVDAGKKTAIKELLKTSREIIDHPYKNDWWKVHVTSFINAHSAQIMEEINARNSGIAHFGGLHKH